MQVYLPKTGSIIMQIDLYFVQLFLNIWLRFLIWNLSKCSKLDHLDFYVFDAGWLKPLTPLLKLNLLINVHGSAFNGLALGLGHMYFFYVLTRMQESCFSKNCKKLSIPSGSRSKKGEKSMKYNLFCNC